jgi:hypothetical protein
LGQAKPYLDQKDRNTPDPILDSFKKPAAPSYMNPGFSGSFQLSTRPNQPAAGPESTTLKEINNACNSSRESNSIKIKDELLANREKELNSKKFDDSSLSRGSDHRPNFFSRKDADPFAQSRFEAGSRPSPPPTNQLPSILSSKAKETAETYTQSQAHLEENRLLKQRISDLETELNRQKRENEHSLKQILDNNQKLIQNTRGQYEREIEHLKEQLEEAYIQNKRLEEEKQHISSAKNLHFARQPSKPSEHRSTQTVDDALEKNFMKLKSLYDTLYRSNQDLLSEHKEVQEKYAKLIKTSTTKSKLHNKDSAADSRKPAIKIKNGEGSSNRLGQNSSSL